MQSQVRVLTAAVIAALAITASGLAIGAGNSAASRAANLIDANPGWANGVAGDAFQAKDAIVDADGTEHVRFSRTYKGLPVIGGDVIVHSKGGNLKSMTQTINNMGRPGLNGRVNADDAIVTAGVAFGGGFDGVPSARQVVYARGRSPQLAWEVTVEGIRADQTPTEMHYIVDAQSGKVVDSWDMIHTAAANGTAKTLFSGNVAVSTNSISGGYEMRDTTRGNGAVNNMKNRTSGSGTIFTDADNLWGNNSTSDTATVAGDAAYGVGKTWDYYKNVHGRNGIANDGRAALSKVHYGRNYVNAFWSDSTFSMSYGDGNGTSYYPLVNLDVAGHEMSHGVTSRSANLTYSGESGGLNEATSDIFGTMVEYYAANSSDTPDYLIGEKIYVSNPNGTKALRYMFKPSLDNASPDCWSSSLGSLDVHYSSGVGNHFFYLLAEGAVVPSGFSSLTPASLVCNGNTAAGGIGRDAAQRIWYRALTVYMTSSSNYASARTASLNAARDLYGSGSTQYNGVASAWSAVNVN